MLPLLGYIGNFHKIFFLPKMQKDYRKTGLLVNILKEIVHTDGVMNYSELCEQLRCYMAYTRISSLLVFCFYFVVCSV